MKLSNRLLACASLVRPGSVAADIGTDHGHLPIYLLQNDICPRVIAADLREGPLNAARRNAALAGVSEISFFLSDGLRNVPLDGVDTVIMAGMGGDTIRMILDREKDIGDIQLILQPQADVPELRRFLGDRDFSIRQEVFARDGNFVYTVLEVRQGGGVPISSGESYRPQGQVDRTSPLYAAYMDRVKLGLEKTVQGIRQAKTVDWERLRFFEEAQNELIELEDRHDDGT